MRDIDEVNSWTLSPPPRELADIVECVYVTEPSSTGLLEAMPDGRADFVLVCSASAPRFEVYGPATRHRRLSVDKGVRYCGMRIRPGLAGSLLEADACRLADQCILFSTFHGLRADLAAQSFDDHGPEAALTDIVGRSLRRPSQTSHWARRAVADIVSCEGDIRVEQIADNLGMSRRSLERIFAADVGDTPKHFVRITRLQALSRRLRSGKSLPWATLAADLGYSDQSHLVRDVRQLTGYPPTAFVGRIRAMPPDWV